jgi:hypothetical protein
MREGAEGRRPIGWPALDYVIDPDQQDSSTSIPSAFAVLLFITSSYLVGCWTGRLAGFSPRSIRSMYDAQCRN